MAAAVNDDGQASAARPNHKKYDRKPSLLLRRRAKCRIRKQQAMEQDRRACEREIRAGETCAGETTADPIATMAIKGVDDGNGRLRETGRCGDRHDRIGQT
jgi:hypothetical protein